MQQAYRARPHRRAIGGRLRPADRRAGQRIDLVEAQAEALGVMHGGQHGKHADPVGDEIGRIERAHHALAERRGEEGFELIERTPASVDCDGISSTSGM
jgi:hypothetical protein